MADSDDYFDDFELDDQAIALLNEQEKNYSTQQALLSAPQPAPKRQKNENGWTPRTSLADTPSFEELELPEISVEADGTYGVREREKPITNSNPQILFSVTQSNSVRAGVVNRSHSNQPSNSQSSSGRSKPPQHPVKLVRTPSFSSQTGVRPPSHPTQGFKQSSFRRTPSASQLRTTTIQTNAQQKLPTTSVIVPDPAAAVVPVEFAQSQIGALKSEMEKLRNDAKAAQTALQTAVDARLAREGEVTILWKAIERTALDHATQISKLKAAKDDADAKQIQMRKESKEEMERLKTQYIFKNQELESTGRRIPSSVRAAKIGRVMPSSQMHLSSDDPGWNGGQTRTVPGPSQAIDSTPSSRRGDPFISQTPDILRNRTIISPKALKFAPKLPGFENSFAPSSPTRLQRARNSGKSRVEDPSDAVGMNQEFSTPSVLHSHVPEDGFYGNSPNKDPIKAFSIYNEDPTMDFAPEVAQPDAITVANSQNYGLTEDFDELNLIDWHEQFRHILSIHRPPLCAIPTLHTLLKVTLPSTLSSPHSDMYLSCCSRILEVLASNSEASGSAQEFIIADSLAHMATILYMCDLTVPLVSLINLATTLILAIQSFSVAILQRSDLTQPPQLLRVAFDIIRHHLKPADQSKPVEPSWQLMAQETMVFLETLAWDIPQDVEEGLCFIPRAHGVLSTILHTGQPTWLLLRSMRLLVFLASRPSQFRCILAWPDSDTTQTIDQAQDVTKIPHIEQICSLLVDVRRTGPEAESLRTLILTFFAITSVMHSDALTILVESQTLIPSLVLYLSHISSSIWEQQENSISSDLFASVVRVVTILHHLVIGQEHTTNLRLKLHQAPQPLFNGITHIFIVTLGRLSYTEPLDSPFIKKSVIEQTADMARDLLELVVEGPEGDSVWEAFHSDQDQENLTDDEDMEAILLGD